MRTLINWAFAGTKVLSVIALLSATAFAATHTVNPDGRATLPPFKPRLTPLRKAMWLWLLRVNIPKTSPLAI
ncbi:MAG: hypothetical protein P9L94_05585 [Candidatus Hinthialibacter antarcticus]|nr:hypothetical protein [Candidatus Hinthialibacter antarcticus]